MLRFSPELARTYLQQRWYLLEWIPSPTPTKSARCTVCTARRNTRKLCSPCVFSYCIRNIARIFYLLYLIYIFWRWSQNMVTFNKIKTFSIVQIFDFPLNLKGEINFHNKFDLTIEPL